GLPQNFSTLATHVDAHKLPRFDGYRAIISGSCSVATNKQVAHFIRSGGAARAIGAVRLAAGEPETERALAWARPLLAQGKGPVLLYSTATPAAVQAIQSQLGAAEAGQLIEHALAEIARGLLDAGVDQLVVACGEISGAVVQALGIEALRIGAQIDPGVPWTMSVAGKRIALALKSGNFGSDDFFTKAFRVLQ
ncbi:MAG TPA: nucleotide-binding domain containing protein, partial [Burkholderiales bacterium]|nr:nucleotide-binding domain containing protein [Burkholderiales bacterium]